MATDSEVSLTSKQRSELGSIAQSGSLPAGYVFRAKLILMLQKEPPSTPLSVGCRPVLPPSFAGSSASSNPDSMGWTPIIWVQKAKVLTPALRARILSATRKKPNDGSTHWSCRKLATALGVSEDAVHRVWKEAGLKPHRLERYLASDDREFESKAADIIGL
jgi:hypothetical protein